MLGQVVRRRDIASSVRTPLTHTLWRGGERSGKTGYSRVLRRLFSGPAGHGNPHENAGENGTFALLRERSANTAHGQPAVVAHRDRRPTAITAGRAGVFSDPRHCSSFLRSSFLRSSCLQDSAAHSDVHCRSRHHTLTRSREAAGCPEPETRSEPAIRDRRPNRWGRATIRTVPRNPVPVGSPRHRTAC